MSEMIHNAENEIGNIAILTSQTSRDTDVKIIKIDDHDCNILHYVDVNKDGTFSDDVKTAPIWDFRTNEY
ncbi:MAG: hypothetical protein KAJ03_01875 [Gammaproteobacteria bacterium]|nr:hypothetical protein [Gammaproteobacteria bacterium]